MIAVDDGIWAGNLDLADIFFLIGMILGFLAAVLSLMVRATAAGASPNRFAPTCAYAAIGCIAFGFMVL